MEGEKQSDKIPATTEEPEPLKEQCLSDLTPNNPKLLVADVAKSVVKNGAGKPDEISSKLDFDENDVDYECDDLALEVNKEEFLDLIEEEEEEDEVQQQLAFGSCFYCEFILDLSDCQGYAAHLSVQHGVRKNVQFLTEVTVARQRQDAVETEAVSPEPLLDAADQKEGQKFIDLDVVSDIESEDEILVDQGKTPIADGGGENGGGVALLPTDAEAISDEEAEGERPTAEQNEKKEKESAPAPDANEGVKGEQDIDEEASSTKAVSEDGAEVSERKRTWEYKSKSHKSDHSDISITDDENEAQPGGGNSDHARVASLGQRARQRKRATCPKCETRHSFSAPCRFMLSGSNREPVGRSGRPERPVNRPAAVTGPRKIRTLPPEEYHNPWKLGSVEGARESTSRPKKIRTLPPEAYHNPDALLPSKKSRSSRRRSRTPTRYRSPTPPRRNLSPENWKSSDSRRYSVEDLRSSLRNRSRDDQSPEDRGGKYTAAAGRTSVDRDGHLVRPDKDLRDMSRFSTASSSESGMHCSLCDSTDHVSKKCPQLYCNSCGQQGHLTKDCPVKTPLASSSSMAYSYPPPAASYYPPVAVATAFTTQTNQLSSWLGSVSSAYSASAYGLPPAGYGGGSSGEAITGYAVGYGSSSAPLNQSSQHQGSLEYYGKAKSSGTLHDQITNEFIRIVDRTTASLTAENVLTDLALAGLTSDSLMSLYLIKGESQLRTALMTALQVNAHKFPLGLTPRVASEALLECLRQRNGGRNTIATAGHTTWA